MSPFPRCDICDFCQEEYLTDFPIKIKGEKNLNFCSNKCYDLFVIQAKKINEYISLLLERV